MIRRVLFALALFNATPALAQTEIEVDDDAGWVHQWTSLSAPTEMAGFERGSITDFSANQLNIGIAYNLDGGSTWATLYIYRPGLLDVSLWQDRALAALLENSTFGTFDVTEAIAGNFTPRSGGGTDSGTILYGPLSGSRPTATGIVLYPHDGWLVKVRMTSTELDQAEIGQLLIEFVSDIELPDATVRYPAARIIEPCEDTLEFNDTDRRGAIGMPRLLMVTTQISMMRSFGDDDEVPDEAANVADRGFCREAGSSAAAGVYRANGDQRSYVLALGDSGMAIGVGQFELAEMVVNQDRGDRFAGTGGRDYWITFSNEERTNIFTHFDGMSLV